MLPDSIKEIQEMTYSMWCVHIENNGQSVLNLNPTSSAPEEHLMSGVKNIRISFDKETWHNWPTRSNPKSMDTFIANIGSDYIGDFPEFIFFKKVHPTLYVSIEYMDNSKGHVYTKKSGLGEF